MRYLGFVFLVVSASCATENAISPPVDAGASTTDASTTSGVDGPTDADVQDASPASDASDAGPWTVKSLPGLALWLNTDVGVVLDPAMPGKVRRWLDQSGKGNDAELVNSPAPSIDPQALNGHDTIHAGGNSSWFRIVDSPSLQWGAGGFTLAMVVKADGAGTSDIRLFEKGDVALRLYVQKPNDIKLKVGADVLSVPANPSKYQLVIARGPALELRIGAVTSTGPTTSYDVSAPGSPVNVFFVGGSPDLYYAEIIAAGGAMPAADLAKLETYLKTKYDL